jgi:hypothetical protein
MKAWIGLAAVAAALFAGNALASDYDGLSAARIRKLKGFVADTTSMSSATNSGDPSADHIYWWIGYIPEGDKRIYFTSYGEALTCVLWERTGEWVPEWVAENLEKLTADGYIKLEK